YDPDGLDVPGLLDARDEYGEIDRTAVPSRVMRLPREAVLATACDILVPAAVSYAITGAGCGDVRARIVVEAANAPTTADAELDLTARGIAVIPDFIANAGAVAWAWWLLLGQVGEDYRDSFDRLRTRMDAKVSSLLTGWTPSAGPIRWAADVSARSRSAEPLVVP
ncbi:glutamate dehydrogenase, partial [Gordonia sihwensis]